MVDETPPAAFFTEAADMATPAERLAELAKYSSLQALIAANPATWSQMLDELSEATEPAVRRAVALNPNASLQVLGGLAREFPGEFLRNPLIPLLNMERPDFVRKLPFLAWASLLRFEDLPKSWLRQLKVGRYIQQETRELVMLHVTQADTAHEEWRAEAHKAGRAYHKKLSQSKVLAAGEEAELFLLFVLLFPAYAGMLREQWPRAFSARPRMAASVLAMQPRVSVQMARLLLRENNAFIRRQVARHPGVGVRALERLALSANARKFRVAGGSGAASEEVVGDREAVRRALARNPRTPVEVLYRFLPEKNSGVRRAATLHPALTDEDRQIMSFDDEPGVRAALATLPQLERELLARLAVDPAAVVRVAVARNLTATSQMLMRLVSDAEPAVRAAAAGNPCLAVELQAALVVDPEVAVRASLSGNACLLEQHALQLAQDSSAKVRRYLAGNPRTAIALLERLWQTREQEVWLGVAHHPQASAEILTDLAQHGELRVRAAVAAHKRAPEAVLRELAQEQRREIWYALAANPRTPLEVLELALATADTELWIRLFNHPTIMREQRRPYLRLLVNSVQRLLAVNRLPNWMRAVVYQYHTALPAALLEVFAQSPLWEERYLAARHPRMSESVLVELARDGIYYVRLAAQEALQRRA